MTRKRIVQVLTELLEEGLTILPLGTGGTLFDALDQPGDLDVAMDRPIAEVINRHAEQLIARGVRPIQRVKYDIGLTEAIWLWDSTDGAVLHLDALCDQQGIGRLGIPTGPIMEAAGQRDVVDAWRTAYLVSKRLWKHQWSRLELLAGSVDATGAHTVLKEVFGTRAAAQAVQLLADQAPAEAWHKASGRLRRGRWVRRCARSGGPHVLALARLRRAAQRLRQPVGYWVHLYGTSAGRAAEELAGTFAVAVHHSRVRRLRNPAFGRMAALPTLLRPGLLVTWSDRPLRSGRGGPHLTLGPSSDADLARVVALAISQRSTAA